MTSLLTIAVPLTRMLRHLGGPGLVLLGIIGSFIPLPGGQEALTIVLAARHRDWWWYYGLAGTLGAVLGGYVPYAVGWSGGKPLLARRLSPRKAEIWMERLHQWGFGAVFMTGLLPPPLPSTPVLLAAGAVRYPRRRFLVALTFGRTIRFMLLAAVAGVYGRRAVRFMAHAVVPMIVISAIGVVAYAGYVLYTRHTRGAEQAEVADAPARIPEEATSSK